MPETIVSGTVRTDLILSNKVMVDMDEVMHFEDQDKYLFETLTRIVSGSEDTENMRHEYMESRLIPDIITVTAAGSAGDTTITVDQPTYAHRDQLIYNTRTNELYLMNEDVGGTSAAGKLTVLNLIGTGGVTTAVAVGDTLVVLPEAHAEGEDIPPAYSNTPVALFTYLMQSDRTLKHSDIQTKTREYGPNQVLINRKQFWIEWKRALNMALYLGQQNREVASASGPRRHSMTGVRERLTTNRIDMTGVPGGLTLASIGEFMRRTKYHTASSDSKVGVCGQNAWASISALPSAAIQTTVSETEWGKRLNRLVTPHGNLSIGYDPMLTQERGLGDVMLILDPPYLKRLRMAGLPERLALNIQNSVDLHNMIDAITGTAGLKVIHEKLHAWVYGIS